MRKDIEIELLKYGEEMKILNKSELARRLECSRTTIANKINKSNIDKPKRVYTSVLDKFKDIIEIKVVKYACSAKGIYQLLKDKYNYTGSYSLVAKYVEKFKTTEQIKVTIRFETTPGYQAQIDWKESLKLVDKFGNEFVVNIFLMILGYSRKKFIKLTFDREQKTLFECLASAFEFYGGVTEELLFDNMKTVVNHAKSNFSNVVFNDKIIEFAKDANFKPTACRAFRPQTKGKVEILAKIMNRLKAYNEEFVNVEDLIKVVNNLNLTINDEIVQGINQTPNERFKKEQNTLSPVNIDLLKPFFITTKEYKVSNESMITFKGKKYSVPTIYIGKYLTVVEGDSYIYIYYTTNLIAEYNSTLDYYLNYKEEHYKDILSKSAYKDKADKQIDEIIKENLKNLDNILIEGDSKYDYIRKFNE